MKTQLVLLLSAAMLASTAHAAEPAGNKARVHGSDPCCTVTAIDRVNGLVTLKNLKTAQVTQVKVDKTRLNTLRIGQKVGPNP